MDAARSGVTSSGAAEPHPAAPPATRKRGRPPKHETAGEAPAAKKRGWLGGTTDARTLTDREIEEYDPSFREFVSNVGIALDGIIAAVTDQDQVDIWAFDEEEIDTLTRVVMRAGKKRARVAMRVRVSVNAQENMVEPGMILVPRVIKTARVLGVPTQRRSRRRG